MNRNRQTNHTAASATLSAARELRALAELLAEQAHDLELAAQQPGVHWGHAGSAQALAHDARNLVARDYYARAGNSEAAAEALVAADVARKLARK